MIAPLGLLIYGVVSFGYALFFLYRVLSKKEWHGLIGIVTCVAMAIMSVALFFKLLPR